MITTHRITALLLFMIAFPAVAQTHFIGVKAGANVTNVIASNFFQQADNRFGINAGLMYEFMLNEHFTLGVDAQYSQKGFTDKFIFTDETGNTTGEFLTERFNYDYVSIPLKAGYVVGNKFSGFLNLGVVPSVLFDARYVSPSFAQLPETTYTITDIVTKFDLGALIEIGANYRFENNYVLFASAAYQQSFMSITNENYFPNSRILHSVMTFSVGCKYALN